MGTAFLLSNCHCILIVGFRMITRQPVSFMESVGVFVGMTGEALPLLAAHLSTPVSVLVVDLLIDKIGVNLGVM
jgi:hypothetical protein